MTEPLISPNFKNWRSDIRERSNPGGKQKNLLFWHVFFAASLAMTLLTGKWLWAARAGWTLLAILFSINLRFAFYALFFYAAWFHPSGFLPDFSLFSLKHYHLAFFLVLTVDAVEDNPVRNILHGIRKARPLYLILALLGIGLLNFFRFEMPLQAFRTPANLALILVSLFYLMGLYDRLCEEDPDSKILPNAMSLFVLGVALQVLVAFQNTLAHTLYYNMPLLHNNHIGILCAFSSFYAMGLFLYEPEPALKRVWGIVTLILAGAIIASCSRTAWFSFLAAFFIFAATGYRYLPSFYRATVRKRHTAAFISVVGILIISLSHLFEMVKNRFQGLPSLLDWRYWQYTLNDYQNFGFLGIFRLQQIYDMKNILRTQPFLGVGFIKQVVDFHGFYFTVLAATGFTGLLIFVIFIRTMIQGILKKIQVQDSNEKPAFFFLRLGAFCAFTAWLFCLLMETYFVQFSAWMTVWLVLIFSQSVCPQEGHSSHEAE